jgi:hypothetical protein
MVVMGLRHLRTRNASRYLSIINAKYTSTTGVVSFICEVLSVCGATDAAHTDTRIESAN